MWKAGTIFLVLACFVHVSRQHGYMADPAQRSSLWRFGYEGAVANHNDNELFCGGKGVQWNTVNQGRCGACGDEFNGTRKNEAGGIYAKQIIARNYTMGEIINVTIKLTAAHKGWFQFKICDHNDWETAVNQTCLDQHVLYLPDEGSTKYDLNISGRSVAGFKNIRVKLPDSMACSQCILQWRYVTGNDWGCDGAGNCCVGCGLTGQETFVNCADISITSASPSTSSTGTPSTTFLTMSSAKSTTSVPSSSSTKSSTISSSTPPTSVASSTSSSGTSSTTSSTVSSATQNTTPILSSILSSTATQTATQSTTVSAEFHAKYCLPGLFSCQPVGVGELPDLWLAVLVDWCVNKCMLGYCPANYCDCECS